ncbi:MAG: DUF3445 domain-containing protein [Oceanicaulis sp.]|uniref:heme-dependent oxidative N-demethylase subunit alpha family protein n=1 Tax=Glycocaulis sp. TaxID=1969725 RepID=UPI0025BB8C9A|nr:heme-dependent oxidative N-demethylase subunit alpha family protein [Glycocaulis sp.]MCC5980378.1 DUF3445 domain-containing protein [Oceanicaulis sp.]MCH8520864.1 DUF3445 domain-containing protein [Glycocaulis sp.]
MVADRRPPFTPWRDGPPRFAVGLKPIEPALWLLPDTEAHTLPERALLLRDRDATHFQDETVLPAAREAVALAGRAMGLENDPSADAPPLWQLAHKVSDDLVLMMPGEEGWRVGAAVLTSPTFFSLPHAAGKTLHELHAPVPGGDGLATRIARVFDHVRPGQVLERFNWTLQAGKDRYTPDGEPLRARAQTARADEAQSLLHVRVERQTITKLPESGAVLFTIRVCIDPVAALASKEKTALAAAWHRADKAARGYKKWAVLDHLVAAALPTP